MLDKSTHGQVQEFLDSFGKSLSESDIDGACDMFLDDCYWRDLVTFTWNIKTLEGKEDLSSRFGRLHHRIFGC